MVQFKLTFKSLKIQNGLIECFLYTAGNVLEQFFIIHLTSVVFL